MSLSVNKDTFVVAGGGAVTLATGFGKILAIVMCTEETSGVQVAKFYDSLSNSGSLIMVVRTNLSSTKDMYFTSNRAPTFSTGLTVDPGNCNVLVTLLAK